MVSKFVQKSLKVSALGAILLAAVTAQAGLFSSREKKASPLPKELEALRKAYMFADKSIGAEEVERKLVEELDGAIGDSWWEKNKGSFQASEKDERVKGYLQTLDKATLEAMRDNAFTTSGKYIPSSIKGNSLRSFEVWKRSNQQAQDAIMKDMRLNPNEIKTGHKTSHHLSEKEVPYGGYFFPDNLGGISRRWNNKDGWLDELFDYKTFHEKVKGDIDDATSEKMAAFKSFDKIGYEKFKATCRSDEKYKGLSKVECYQKMNPKWIADLGKDLVVAKLKKLTQAELNGLSPTEKYDLANGYYDFRSTSFEKFYKGKRRKVGTKNAPFFSTLLFNLYWEGRCNADRACGICNRHNEPVHQLSVNLEEIGKKLVFEPLDIKALFMSTYFYVENYAMMGGRNSGSERDNAVPPNMAAFDVLLRGAFTKNNFPFVIDNHNNNTVNNVTVIGFDRVVTGVRNIGKSELKTLGKRVELAEKKSKEAAGADNAGSPRNFGDGKDANSFQNELELYKRLNSATKVIKVKTKLKLLSEAPIDEANAPTKKAIVEKGKFTKEEEIEYELYLNDKNEIVEGKYVKGNMDFIWFADGRGTEEEQEDGNTYIKYNTMKDLAIKSSVKAQELDRRIFPGQTKQ